MRNFIVNSWDGVMDARWNPLKNIPDMQVRHLVLQILAWLWCVAFSLYFGSWVLLGITFASHLIIILAIVVTVTTFRLTETTFRLKAGYHSVNRSRGAIWVNGKKTELPPGDPGGEHE